MSSYSLLESAFRTGDGVFAVDPGQRIVFWNPGAQSILGYSPEEVSGRLCFEVIQGTDELGRVVCVEGCPMTNCLRHPGSNGKEGGGQNLQARARDGSLRWLSLSHVFIDSIEGQPAAMVHIFRDITPEVAAKRLLGRLAEQLTGYGLLPSPTVAEYDVAPLLTERELQVLALLAQGEGTSSIARRLTISNTTARNHIQNILSKLGAHNRLEAVTYAIRNRLVDPGPTQLDLEP